MSDPNPMSDSTVSPSDALTDADLGADTPDAPDDAGESAREVSISDMLLSTEPDEDPARYSLPREYAHVVVGIKKVLSGAGANVGKGVPAIQNFAMAGLGFMFGGDDGDEQDEQEQEDDVNAPTGADAV